MTRARRIVDDAWRSGALAIGAVGLAWLVWVQAQIPGPVFPSGDGGLKFLMLEQFAAGRTGVDLALPAEPWVRRVWARGAYPFGPPFVHEIEGREIVAFPPTLPFLTAPLYRVAGDRALCVLPTLALLVLWTRTFFLARRLGFGPSATGATLLGLVLASHLTLYGAAFWEHAPAAALAFCGVAELIAATRGSLPPWRAGLGGLWLGAAAWFRPEAIGLGLVVVLAFGVRAWRHSSRATWAVHAAGLGVALGAWVAFNLAAFGTPWGAHGLDVVGREDVIARQLGAWPGRLAELAGLLAVWVPFAVPTLVGSIAIVRSRSAHAAWAAPTLAASVAFVAVTAFIVPNAGGLQWGPRYLTPAVPLLAVLLGACWESSLERGGGVRAVSVAGVLGLALAAGGLYDGLYMPWVLARDYRTRVWPVVEVLRRASPLPLVATNAYIPQDLASLLRSRPVFLVSTGPDFEPRLAGLAEQLAASGHRQFHLVVSPAGPADRVPGPSVERIAETVAIVHGGTRVDLVALGEFGGGYVVYTCGTSG